MIVNPNVRTVTFYEYEGQDPDILNRLSNLRIPPSLEVQAAMAIVERLESQPQPDIVITKEKLITASGQVKSDWYQYKVTTSKEVWFAETAKISV